MELYQLRTFVAVADEGHLTRAAEKLHSSQSAVSAHIKALEDEFGVALFSRTPKGMQLTKAGELLKEKAEQTLASAEELTLKANSFQTELSGTVTLGLNIDPKYLKISDLFATLKNSFPGLGLQLLQKMSWEVLDEIKSGEIDAGFVYETETKGDIEVLPLKTFNLLLAGPVNLKNRLKSDSLRDLCKLPWIWTPEQCCYSHIYERLFEPFNLTPLKAAVSDQESTMKTLASAGVGLTLMIEEEAKDALKAGLIAIKPQPVEKIKLFFAYHKKQFEDPVLRGVIDSIKEIWKEIPEPHPAD